MDRLPLISLANEHHETAATLQTLFRSKADPESVLNSLAGFPLQPAGQPLTYLTRAIATQTLLFIGARSFSHFLNATERYLPLLRGIATNSTERMDILRNVGSFWRESGQMRVIIGDKLMQYGIVGGEDVVRWVFEEQEEEMLGSGVGGRGEEREKTAEQWMAGQKWDVLRMGVDKVNGRVVGVRRKIVALEAEEEEKKGGRRAATMVDEGEGDDGKREGMDVDAETNGSSYYLA
jgi:nuclear cap-binding protein subunit 1